MNGLDNITKAILDDANAQADKILDEARKNADEILKNAKAQAAELEKQINDDTEKRVKAIEMNAESAAAQNKRNELLKAKTKLIDSIFDKAIKALLELSDDDYFNALKSLIAQNAINGDGELILNSKDRARCPSGFMNMVGASVTGPKSLSLSSETNDKIIGGCILKYGDVEINLGFDRIIAAKREQLVDKVNSVLFA